MVSFCGNYYYGQSDLSVEITLMDKKKKDPFDVTTIMDRKSNPSEVQYLPICPHKGNCQYGLTKRTLAFFEEVGGSLVWLN